MIKKYSMNVIKELFGGDKQGLHVDTNAEYPRSYPETFWIYQNGKWRFSNMSEFIEVGRSLGFSNLNENRLFSFHKAGVLGRMLWYKIRSKHWAKKEPDFFSTAQKHNLVFD